MNSIVLIGEVLAEPELRYTPDNLAVTSLLLSFPSLRPEEPAYQVRVSSFGELAQKVVDNCRVGDQVTVEGQLHMNLVERDGRKEKLAEITARRIHQLGAGQVLSLTGMSESSTAVRDSGTESLSPKPAPAAAPSNPDEIPF
ncbi:single-stranded DNA-binding protein [Synechococcus sp. Nb3U1]|uniref:single-stranded DNA-binding protein n=1 Tax=Synechococcus sp. Nb3U1 TaxID=1914529 RepID=UPI001F462A99|nr:single-stranded DNA-binding protein [Synechococcus sp. Nb3U1]MCF2971709.1 single-stranded DNA-binding protein [Synechococcus sp. Nb3U1]